MLRDRRVLLLLVALVVAAVVVGVVVAVSAGGGDSSSATTTTSSSSTPGEENTLLGGIPQNGITLGKASAPVALVEFADPQCPYCAEWSNKAFPTVVEQFVRTGKVRLEYRGAHFIGSDSEKALRAELAAGLQNKLWQMMEGLYSHQGAENGGWVTDDLLREVGATVPGLDVERMMDEMDSSEVDKQIQEADNLAADWQVRGTPSFYIVRPPSRPQILQFSSLEGSGFASALSAALGE